MSNAPVSVNGVSPNMLKEHVDRIEELERQKQGIADDIAARKKMAKHDGFNVKTINKLVTRRKKKPTEVQEEDLLLDTYERAIQAIEDPDSNEVAA